MTEELWRRGAVELAGMIAERSVSAREVVDAHLERIEAVNPRLNAIAVVLAEEARAAADAADSNVERPSGHRVALLAEPPGGDTHPEVAAAVRRAGDVLSEAGYDVVEAVPPLYEDSSSTSRVRRSSRSAPRTCSWRSPSGVRSPARGRRSCSSIR